MTTRTTLRHALIAAAAVAMAGSALAAETTEAAIERLSGLLKETKTRYTEMKVEGRNPAGELAGTMKQWGAWDGTSYRSRLESTSSQKLMGRDEPITAESLSVSDGKAMWNQVSAAGRTSVTKMPVAQKDATPVAALKNMLSQGTFTVTGTETIAGDECTVLSGVVKNAMGEQKLGYWFSNKSGVMLKMTVDMGPTGTTTLTAQKVVTNEPIEESRFQYEPPAGVEVTDLTKAAEPVGEAAKAAEKAAEGEPKK